MQQQTPTVEFLKKLSNHFESQPLAKTYAIGSFYFKSKLKEICLNPILDSGGILNLYEISILTPKFKWTYDVCFNRVFISPWLRRYKVKPFRRWEKSLRGFHEPSIRSTPCCRYYAKNRRKFEDLRRQEYFYSRIFPPMSERNEHRPPPLTNPKLIPATELWN